MSKNKTLTNTQKKFLKGIAHGLNPIIMIGANGVTESLMTELETSLAHHELLKIKMAVNDRDDRKQILEHILQETGAELVQTIGKTLVIFRQNEDTELPLPK